MSAGGAGGAASSSAAISNSPASAYALYRATGLGKAFLESLGEMYQEQEMTNDQVIQSTLTFDKVFNRHLAEQTPPVKVQVGGELSSYRYCDAVWTLNIKNAKFVGNEGVIESPMVKVVACEWKKPPTTKKQRTK